MSRAGDVEIDAYGKFFFPGDREHHVDRYRERRSAEGYGVGAFGEVQVEEEGVLRVGEHFEHPRCTTGEIAVAFAQVRDLNGVTGGEERTAEVDGLGEGADVDRFMWIHMEGLG